MENKYEEIAGMKFSIDVFRTTTNIPMCMSIKDIQESVLSSYTQNYRTRCLINTTATTLIEIKHDSY